MHKVARYRCRAGCTVDSVRLIEAAQFLFFVPSAENKTPEHKKIHQINYRGKQKTIKHRSFFQIY